MAFLSMLVARYFLLDLHLSDNIVDLKGLRGLLHTQQSGSVSDDVGKR